MNAHMQEIIDRELYFKYDQEKYLLALQESICKQPSNSDLIYYYCVVGILTPPIIELIPPSRSREGLSVRFQYHQPRSHTVGPPIGTEAREVGYVALVNEQINAQVRIGACKCQMGVEYGTCMILW
ncbi:hypothetical protein BGX24_000448 [Mortierella sp. AD032]|nr:hypothetical protein BGX24_000448 [Mortierella sp. AD032]